MLISLSIFLFTKRQLPSPAKKAKEETVTYSAEEKAAMATEIKQRMAALFAVLGIAIFFWFSFHQNGTSLSLFARDFVKTDSVQPDTSYENFIHNMVELEVESTFRYMETLCRLGYSIPELSPSLCHIIASGMLGGLVEIVVHDIPQEQALRDVEQLREFYTAGC